MPLYSFDTQDELIDFYDRAGEIRKTTYYSALLMVAVLGVYLSCYALVPGTFVSIPIEAVLLICLILAVLFVHVPFMLGRERVIMELTAGFSGSKFRDICDLLRRKTPTWNPRLLGLLIGAGALGPVGAWILKCVTETLKRAQ